MNLKAHAKSLEVMWASAKERTRVSIARVLQNLFFLSEQTRLAAKFEHLSAKAV